MILEHFFSSLPKETSFPLADNFHFFLTSCTPTFQPWETANELFVCISSVQSLSHVRLFVTPWLAACQASLSVTNSWSLLKLMSIELVMPSNHLILCRLLLLPPIPPSINESTQWVDSSHESTLSMRWPKYWSFSFSISPSNEHPGLIAFRMDWLDLLAVQGTLKTLALSFSSQSSSHIHTWPLEKP